MDWLFHGGPYPRIIEFLTLFHFIELMINERIRVIYSYDFLSRYGLFEDMIFMVVNKFCGCGDFLFFVERWKKKFLGLKVFFCINVIQIGWKNINFQMK